MNGVKWGEFKFKDIFNHIEQGRRLKKEDQKAGNIPFIMAGTTNTGVVGYISNPVASFPSNSITIDIFGNTFYRNFDFGAGDDTGVYWNDEIFYSENIMLFFVISIQNSLKGKFSFGKKLRSSQSFDFKISLPLKEKSLDFSNPCDNIKNIDFDFMESFISELEEERISELNAYLTATGLSDYTLTSEEENALEAFKTAMWKEYRIGELYQKLNLHNKDFDKRKDTVSEPTKEFSLPIINAKHGDNGIMFYGNENIFDSAEMTIDIVQNGAIATGDVYPQPQKTGVLWDAYLVKALKYEDTRESLFFMTSSIQKSIKKKFCYEFKATWERVQEEKIFLPTKNNAPDYETMETFIKAVEKLVIKDVVLYADSKIAATKKVVKKNKAEYKLDSDYGLLNAAQS